MKGILAFPAVLLCAALGVFATYGMHEFNMKKLEDAVRQGRKEEAKTQLSYLTVPSQAQKAEGAAAKKVPMKLVPRTLDRGRILTSALKEAIKAGDFDIVYMLVSEYGADVNSKKGARGYLSKTPLGFAKEYQKKSPEPNYIIGFLQREGAVD